MKTKLLALGIIALLALSVFAVVPAFSYEPPPPTYPYVLYKT